MTKSSFRILSVAAILVATRALNAEQPKSAAIPVTVDERVELLSIIFRLQGAREYHQAKETVPYVKAVDAYFAPFKDHEAIRLAGKLRQERGISYDAVAWFAVHIQGSPKLEPKVAFDNKNLVMEQRWTPAIAAKFLAAVQKFADDSKAFDFFKKNRDFYDHSAGRLADEIGKRPYRQWLDEFFGAKPGAKFSATVGLLNGGANYGTTLRVKGEREEILPIIGASKFDNDGLPIFDQDSANLIAHEFCHAYCNPMIDRFADQILPSGEKIFPLRAELMRSQAYGSARIMLYESLVRASTHRFLVKHGAPQEAARQLQDEVRRGFLWTPDLSKLLADYEASRDKFKTFEAFMPRVVEFFQRVATEIDARLAKLPQVKSITPAPGGDVDPSATELRIEFDRPMDVRAYGIRGQKSDMPTFVGKARFSDDQTTFIIGIKLEPGKTYKYSLNAIWAPGFVSAEGLPPDPVAVTFTTKKE
jgi:hypothetical protein